MQYQSLSSLVTSSTTLHEPLLLERPESLSDRLWQWMQQRVPGETKLRVVDSAGLASEPSVHTGIEIITDNSPALLDSLRTALQQKNIALLNLQLSIFQLVRHPSGELMAIATESQVNAIEEALIQIELLSEVKPEQCIEIQSVLHAAIRTWEQDLQDHLTLIVGHPQASVWRDHYAGKFPISYQEHCSAIHAVEDIQYMMHLIDDSEIMIRFYPAEGEENHFWLKWFHLNQSLPLSNMIPMLEHLGLQVISSRPYEIPIKTGQCFYLNEFFVRYHGRRSIQLEESKILLEDALKALWHGWVDNDGMNRLILSVGLGWRQVAMLRSYSKYFIQIKLGFSERYVETVLLHHPEITRNLVQLFCERFDPQLQSGAEQREQLLMEDINEALEALDNIDEDRILRRYVDLIQGTVRTNFYQYNAAGQPKTYMAYKFLPRTIPDLLKPLPFYEIFVYSPQMEGLHLRSGKISRGGIRCSDRVEDYRTEILALMKAQQVKNSAIVPMGATGSFIAKNISEWLSDEQQKQVMMECYGTFIAGLLDLTDNLKDNQVIQPEQVVCKDDDDYYLVIADDKGTTDFADMANAISVARQFWLKDAFASGGSVGYDHKKMGIIAQGVWVSVQRHFRELDIHMQHQPITVMGIGDMSGDVFGNGLLASEQLQLVAAFNQSYIFIDPNPDLVVSFNERKRLFNLPNSNWSDYDKNLISSGGGVFSRQAKIIHTTPEMRLKLQIGALRLTPNELIQYLLKAPVDLIWNGGVGTYFKSSMESHLDVGDKSNDGIRINGSDIKAKVIAEGGNLGVTQLGRVEYAMKGGLSNTDFCDNSAGVDCSDHEVNLKILLHTMIQKKEMTQEQSNLLLKELTAEVAALVLLNNDRQAQAVSIALAESSHHLEGYRRYINALDLEGKIDREVDFIPSHEELLARKNNGTGLFRPELAFLLACCKNDLKEELVTSSVPDDPYISRELSRMFPQIISDRYSTQLAQHQLKREIIATHVANHFVNFMGVTFIHRIKEACGASVQEIVKAYIAARDIFRLEQFWQSVEALQDHVSESHQRFLLLAYTQLVRLSTSWILRNSDHTLNVADWVNRYSPGVEMIARELPLLLSGERLEIWEAHYAEYIQLGLDEQLAAWAAGIEGMTPVLAIIQAADATNKPILDVAKIFYELGDRLNLYWFSQQIEQLPAEDHWQSLAREGYRDDLDEQQRRLTAAILSMEIASANVSTEEDCQARIRAWINRYQQDVHRWRMLTHEFELSPPKDFAIYAVALRELARVAK